MNNYLKIIEENLSDNDKALLERIYAPEVVTIPPCDASRSMCVTPDGEIRIYGAFGKTHPEDVGNMVYSSSKDCGLSWKTHLITDENVLGCAGYNPQTGRYIACYPNEYRPDLDKNFGKSGTWAILNDEGYDSTNNRFVKISDDKVLVLKLPFYLESCNRWFIIGQYQYPHNTNVIIVVFYSDDDGETWTENRLEEEPLVYEVKPPHKGIRWQNYYCEPSIVELSDGELVMMIRTTMDYHYTCRSKDKGETWSKPEQSVFHGTNTMPILQKLSDGRILFFWCNTQLLPEIDQKNVFPPLTEDDLLGNGEDVFTNRDANHLAVSEDDMKTWTAIRELYLNPIRNNSDFRSIGGVDSRDKSVHQGQILELPYNKVMIHFGQNISARKVVIFDLDWLYEKERYENFRFGTSNVSTQMYIHSNLGNYKGFSGHCAYNRTHGAMLAPDPDGNYEEALRVCRVEDERLVYKKQGVVWNFPASAEGKVEIRLQVVGSGVSISLTDHWYNPVDEEIKNEAHVNFNVDKKCGWTDVVINYSPEKAEIFIGDEKYTKEINLPAPLGLMYLHIQTLAEEEDMQGTFIKSLRKSQINAMSLT